MIWSRPITMGSSPRLRSALLAGLLVLPTWAGCGGSNLEGRVYDGDDLTFRVGPVPPSWRVVELESALVAFRDDTNLASIAVNGRCGKDGDDVPLEALTHHLFLHFTERQVLRQERVQLDGREALRTELHAELDGVPKHFLVYVLKKDGCVYDFLHVTDRSDPLAIERFERFVQGFSTIEPA